MRSLYICFPFFFLFLRGRERVVYEKYEKKGKGDIQNRFYTPSGVGVYTGEIWTPVVIRGSIYRGVTRNI